MRARALHSTILEIGCWPHVSRNMKVEGGGLEEGGRVGGRGDGAGGKWEEESILCQTIPRILHQQRYEDLQFAGLL